jgi:adenosylcobinamide-GDP ribazoletransferase
VIILLLTTKYLLQQELGAVLQNNLPRKAAIIIATFPFIFLILISKQKGVEIILAILFSGYILRQLMLQRIGGMTGDTAGAFIEILEVVILTSFAIL